MYVSDIRDEGKEVINMKKAKLWISLLSAAVMASTSVMGAFAAHYKGDIDRNDKVNLSDVAAIQKYLIGEGSIDSENLIYADMNDDGKINVFDLVIAKRTVLGSAELEEVPSLTTPAVTTTVTTTTTTATQTTATTKATTKATTQATTKATTTTTTTKATTTTTTTTKATTSETTQATTTKATTTTTEAVTTKPTTVTTEVTTKATTAATTALTSGTNAQSATAFTLEPSQTARFELDSEKNIDSIEFEADTENNFNMHVYVHTTGNTWVAWFDINCTDGVLSYSNNESTTDAITIDGNKIKVEFKDGIAGEALVFLSNLGTAEITLTKIVMEGDETEPVVTSVSVSETTSTETTVATTTTTTASQTQEEVTVTTLISISEVTSATTQTTSATTAQTTSVTNSTQQTSFEVEGEVSKELDSAKTVDTLTITIDTSKDFDLNVCLGTDWDAYFDLMCTNGTITKKGNEKGFDELIIDGNTVTIKFSEGISAGVLIFSKNSGTIIINNYELTYTEDTE